MATKHAYDIIPIGCEMSQYGFWVVTLSVRPGARVQCMIALTGISSREAVDAALRSYGQISAARKAVK